MASMWDQTNQALNRLGNSFKYQNQQEQQGVTNRLNQEKMRLAGEQNRRMDEASVRDQTTFDQSQDKRKRTEQLEKSKLLYNGMSPIFAAKTPEAEKAAYAAYIKGNEDLGYQDSSLAPPYSPEVKASLQDSFKSLGARLGITQANAAAKQKHQWEIEKIAAKKNIPAKVLEHELGIRMQNVVGNLKLATDPDNGVMKGVVSKEDLPDLKRRAKKYGFRVLDAEKTWTGSGWKVAVVPNWGALNKQLKSEGKGEQSEIDAILGDLGATSSGDTADDPKEKAASASAAKPRSTKKSAADRYTKLRQGTEHGDVYGDVMVDGELVRRNRVVQGQPRNKSYGNRTYYNQAYPDYVQELRNLGMKPPDVRTGHNRLQ